VLRIFRLLSFVFCALLLWGAGASAQVTIRLIGDDAQGVRHFLDIDRIETEGDIRRYWRVQNLPKRNEVGALSTRTRQELNCAAKTLRDLVTVHYQGVQASGPIVITLANKSPDFHPFTDGTPDHKIFARICLGLSPG